MWQRKDAPEHARAKRYEGAVVRDIDEKAILLRKRVDVSPDGTPRD